MNAGITGIAIAPEITVPLPDVTQMTALIYLFISAKTMPIIILGILNMNIPGIK